MQIGTIDTNEILGLDFNSPNNYANVTDYFGFIQEAVTNGLLEDFFNDESNGFDQEEKDDLVALKNAVEKLSRTIAANSR